MPSIEFGNMEEIVEDEGDIEEDINIHEIEYTDGSNGVVKNFSQNVLNVLNGIVIIYLNNVVLNVFVRTVIKIKVILI